MWKWNFDFSVGIGWLFLIGAIFVVAVAGLNYLGYYYAKKAAKEGTIDKKMNIAVLAINGLISYGTKSRSFFQKTISMIEAVAERKPKALILRMNSPGGTMAGSNEIYEALNKLKRKGIKIVVLMEDVAASGGLYISMAADKIVANPGVITGSIGVIIHHVDMSKLFEKIGINSDNVKSGQYKDMLSNSKAMDEGARKLVSETIQDCLEQFIGVVAGSRKLDKETVRTFADGRIFNGSQAQRLGLVDELGSYETAIRAARDLAGIEDGKENVQEISPPTSILERFGILGQISSFVDRADSFLVSSELNGMPMYLMK